jgi:hypothetical protein
LSVATRAKSLLAFDPDRHFAFAVRCGLDVDDAGPATYGAVFRIDLAFAATEVHVELVDFAAEWADDFRGRASFRSTRSDAFV